LFFVKHRRCFSDLICETVEYLTGGTILEFALRAIRNTIIPVIACIILLILSGAAPANSEDKAYYHLVVLGDPHLPGKNINAKEHVIQDINSWPDVDMVIAVGDICEVTGSSEEYAAAKKFFGKLQAPFCAIVGNHDFIYEDVIGPNGKKKRSAPAIRDAKLNEFREIFGLPALYYSKKLAGYSLIFLSPEGSDHLTELSEQQLEWFRLELDKNKKIPTIVFFHAPLDGTLLNYKKSANTPNFITQPAGKIHEILMKNPQVFVWVSGHTHTPPTEESFASAINVYEHHITDIHNTDMKRETIWTNSLFLYPDKIIVKTYDHKKGAWLPKFERTILAPRL